MISPQRRAEVIDALRRGTVPKAGLDALAVGYYPEKTPGSAGVTVAV